MANEEPRSKRTEKPTSRRLQKSREQGQVPRSQELPAALAVGAILLFARIFGGRLFGSAESFVARSIAAIAAPPDDAAALREALRSAFATGVALGAPVIGFVAVGSAIGQFSQGGFVFTGAGLTPNPEKFNPVANLKGIFTLKRGVTTLRTMLKLALVVWVVWASVSPEAPAVLALSGHGPREIALFTGSLVARLVFKFFVFALVLALADYLYQKFEHTRGLKMSKQEIKDERRELEGDPLVRSRQRARQMALARRRMMAEVPKANVVVVNPTHCAVALRYERSRGGAPRIVAKGTDRIAARIRAIAEEHKVPIYEDPPLAWALYRAVEIDREIPADFYKAVAEVLAHVFRLKRGGRPKPRRPATRTAPLPGASDQTSRAGGDDPEGRAE